MNTIIFSIGSNIGDRLSHLQYAVTSLGIKIGEVNKKSSIYESKAWGFTQQKDFLNQVIEIKTKKNVFECLELLQKIEKSRFRERKIHWGPRTLDIDILFFNNEIIKSTKLTIPHPFIEERIFVLLPLNEILKDFIHPIFNKNINFLLKNCKDKSSIELFTNGL